MTSFMLFIAALISFVSSAQVWADSSEQDVAQLRRQVEELKDVVGELRGTIQAQQARLAVLEQGRGSTAPSSVSLVSAAPTPSAGGEYYTAPRGNPQMAKTGLQALNPEIGVLADIVAQTSESSQVDAEGNDKISAREVELIFGHPIDPYSRLDVTATFSDFEAASLEEAYITHWGMPAEMRAKIGRMRPKIGKASAVHRDVLETADEPLVVSQYLGAEGLTRTGVELSGFIPAPWTAVTHELTGGIMEGGVGEGGTLFGSTRRRPSFYTHLKNFWDISDVSNLEVGATYLTGSDDADSSYEVNALGLDATLIHYVTPTNKFKWQNELYVQDRKETTTFAEDGTELNVQNNPWGAYSLLDYRLSPRFGVGGRVDYVEPIGAARSSLVRQGDVGLSGYLTFYQSEFARWRLQYRHSTFAAGGDDNAVFLQGTVAIGVHKHQLQ
ncbi:MAG: hypothetical protein HYY15_00440 [Candidatus Omnitrophica bacterium]|nr:hypothetical protein [Candidatus Omnitrophota bacterium]